MPSRLMCNNAKSEDPEEEGCTMKQNLGDDIDQLSSFRCYNFQPSIKCLPTMHNTSGHLPNSDTTHELMAAIGCSNIDRKGNMQAVGGNRSILLVKVGG